MTTKTNLRSRIRNNTQGFTIVELIFAMGGLSIIAAGIRWLM